MVEMSPTPCSHIPQDVKRIVLGFTCCHDLVYLKSSTNHNKFPQPSSPFCNMFHFSVLSFRYDNEPLKRNGVLLTQPEDSTLLVIYSDMASTGNRSQVYSFLHNRDYFRTILTDKTGFTLTKSRRVQWLTRNSHKPWHHIFLIRGLWSSIAIENSSG